MGCRLCQNSTVKRYLDSASIFSKRRRRYTLEAVFTAASSQTHRYLLLTASIFTKFTRSETVTSLNITSCQGSSGARGLGLEAWCAHEMRRLYIL